MSNQFVLLRSNDHYTGDGLVCARLFKSICGKAEISFDGGMPNAQNVKAPWTVMYTSPDEIAILPFPLNAWGGSSGGHYNLLNARTNQVDCAFSTQIQEFHLGHSSLVAYWVRHEHQGFAVSLFFMMKGKICLTVEHRSYEPFEHRWLSSYVNGSNSTGFFGRNVVHEDFGDTVLFIGECRTLFRFSFSKYFAKDSYLEPLCSGVVLVSRNGRRLVCVRADGRLTASDSPQANSRPSLTRPVATLISERRLWPEHLGP